MLCHVPYVHVAKSTFSFQLLYAALCHFAGLGIKVENFSRGWSSDQRWNSFWSKLKSRINVCLDKKNYFMSWPSNTSEHTSRLWLLDGQSIYWPIIWGKKLLRFLIKINKSNYLTVAFRVKVTHKNESKVHLRVRLIMFWYKCFC